MSDLANLAVNAKHAPASAAARAKVSLMQFQADLTSAFDAILADRQPVRRDNPEPRPAPREAATETRAERADSPGPRGPRERVETPKSGRAEPASAARDQAPRATKENDGTGDDAAAVRSGNETSGATGATEPEETTKTGADTDSEAADAADADVQVANAPTRAAIDPLAVGAEAETETESAPEKAKTVTGETDVPDAAATDTEVRPAGDDTPVAGTTPDDARKETPVPTAAADTRAGIATVQAAQTSETRADAAGKSAAASDPALPRTDAEAARQATRNGQNGQNGSAPATDPKSRPAGTDGETSPPKPDQNAEKAGLRRQAAEAPRAGARPQTSPFATELGGRTGTQTTSATANSVHPLAGQTDAPSQVFRATGQTAQGYIPSLPIRAIALHIASRVADGARAFQIRLDPPELGRIDVRMEISRGGQVTAHLTVDRPETLEALQRDQRGLERTLQNAGLDTRDGGLSFNLRQDAQARGEGRDGGGPFNRDFTEDAADETEWLAQDGRPRLLGLSALDIRV
jgi:hypothetical protein